MDLIAKHHPTDILMVHPKVAEDHRVQYSHLDTEESSIQVRVDGTLQTVTVHRSKAVQDRDGVRRQFLLLSHPWFEERARQSLYPNPLSRRKVLQFFSLWNQCVGKLLATYCPDVFHCPDFHSAIAPWYALPMCPRLRMILVLHNAEYQGSIATDMLTSDQLQVMAEVFNVPKMFVKQHLVFEGRFNMLKAAVDFLLEKQQGVGACAVSEYYAAECHSRYSVFWRLPKFRGLDNPMLEEERATLRADLKTQKAEAKARCQEHFGLKEDADARLFVSLGRLVRQKGVDLLADVTEWLLSTYPQAQLIVIGPPADGFGFYAARKLEKLAETAAFKGRLSVCCEFLEVPEDLKWASDYCLMPSRDEPFGYVDVEFAWRGAVIVGAQAGGLGKVPGFYYVAQNRESLTRLRRELRSVISAAMRAPSSALHALSRQALQCNFPVEDWQNRLLDLYQQVVDTRDVAALESPARLPATWFPTHHPELEHVEASGPSGPSAVSFSGSYLESQDGSHELPTEEFILRQELSEEELNTLVRAKLDILDQDIETILRSIGSDRDSEYETSPVSKWLTAHWLGTARIHWLVSCGYIACPLSSLLILVVATEWGIRGSTELPEWFKRFPWFKTVFGNGGLDPPILNMLLFSTNALSTALGAPLWTFAACWIQPRRLLAAAMLFQVPVLLTMLAVHRPNVSLATSVVFLQGLFSSGSLLFVAFNFMLSIKADISHAAKRMGILEMVRNAVTWLITGYIFLTSPSTQVGSEEQPLPPSVILLLTPLALVTFLATVVPGALFLAAPGPYRDDRLPGWELNLFCKRRTFIILSLSDVLGCLALFPSTCYIRWWFANGWKGQDLAWLSLAFAMFLAVVTYCWARTLEHATVHGLALLIGITLLLPPAPMLRAVVQDEVSTFTFLGRSDTALAICCLSLILEGIRSSSAWAVKVRVLNSRWRLLSYGTVSVILQGLASLVSPFLCEVIARRRGSSFISDNEKELANASLVSVVPLCLAQFVVQMFAAPCIRQDLGVASSSSLYRDPPRRASINQARCGCLCRTIQACSIKHAMALRRLPPRLAIGCGCCLGIAALVIEVVLVHKPFPFEPARRCLQQGISRSLCRLIADETDTRPADTFAEFGHGPYGTNKFGQSTTGKFNCHQRMKRLNGNTFAFWDEGRCQVWSCDPRFPGQIPDQPLVGAEIWSRHCNMSMQNHIMVHLFEWPWPAIAEECETWLGPAGVTAVQVSPPTEHVLGDSWSTRYQPVSFKLHSRSGTPAQFSDMISRCQKSGVSIMVDTILNHMASPLVQSPKKDRGKKCGQSEDTPTSSTAPCLGWSGTGYGNREFRHGTLGLDYFERQDFHHYEGNFESNCGLPPWTNNRFLCDLYALVDLNTESVAVQQQLQSYLKVLFERGVTMLRLDAAMHVYPESFLKILDPFPFDYIVQEFFPGPLKFEQDTLRKATSVGSLTNFDFGQQVAQVLFDSWQGGKWKNRTANFADLLHIGSPSADCDYAICKTVYPPEHSLLFVDNHDQQRQLWKPEKGGPPRSPVCRWNGKDVADCRPIYKHGLEYNLAQLFMLAWPYGDAVRLMSSYAWEDFDQGPPGVQPDSLHDSPSSPLRRCRTTPSTSPVTELYDQDTANPWVCEHRWQGVPGLIRFRKLVGPGAKVNQSWSDAYGHVAFGVEEAAFVAMNRGFNWVTQIGTSTSWELRGMNTSLPSGAYCNLALATQPVPVPESWTGSCFGDAIVDVVIDVNGTILQGEVPASGVVALHIAFSKRTEDLLVPTQ
ncbi:mok14, partial [Symbiodinium sp. CCMP2456]